MHMSLEIIMPPVPGVGMPTMEHINECVSVLMAPFSEENDEGPSVPKWWDWWVIGGRFAGNKLMAGLDRDKMIEFQSWLQAEKITVSGLQCGKQEISPATQIPKVDAKWGELFPHLAGQPCALFNHSNDQYDREGNGQLPDDVLHFRDVPRDMTCSRVMIAGPSYDDSGMEANWMICEDIWNGANHVPTAWDQTLGGALNMFMDYADRYSEEAKEKYIPTDNWLIVTVDYHS